MLRNKEMLQCSLDIYFHFDYRSSITMLEKEIAEKVWVRGRNWHLNIQWCSGKSHFKIYPLLKMSSCIKIYNSGELFDYDTVFRWLNLPEELELSRFYMNQWSDLEIVSRQAYFGKNDVVEIPASYRKVINGCIEKGCVRKASPEDVRLKSVRK